MDFDEKDDDVDMYGGATSAEDDEFDQIVGRSKHFEFVFRILCIKLIL